MRERARRRKSSKERQKLPRRYRSRVLSEMAQRRECDVGAAGDRRSQSQPATVKSKCPGWVVRWKGLQRNRPSRGRGGASPGQFLQKSLKRSGAISVYLTVC